MTGNGVNNFNLCSSFTTKQCTVCNIRHAPPQALKHSTKFYLISLWWSWPPVACTILHHKTICELSRYSSIGVRFILQIGKSSAIICNYTSLLRRSNCIPTPHRPAHKTRKKGKKFAIMLKSYSKKIRTLWLWGEFLKKAIFPGRVVKLYGAFANVF